LRLTLLRKEYTRRYVGYPVRQRGEEKKFCCGVTEVHTLTNKSTWRCINETEISRPNSHGVLKTAKWKYYAPKLLHARVDADHDRIVELCEWFQRNVGEVA
jgi:hypothetical protein